MVKCGEEVGRFEFDLNVRIKTLGMFLLTGVAVIVIIVLKGMSTIAAVVVTMSAI